MLLTLGYNLGMGPLDSIDFSWRNIRSTLGFRPAFVTSPHSYIASGRTVSNYASTQAVRSGYN